MILLNFSYKQFVLILINLCLSFKNILVPFYFRYASWKQHIFRLCFLIQFENLCIIMENYKHFVLHSNILSWVLHLLKNISLVLWNVVVCFSFIFSNYANGEGKGNPLQYSCLENFMDIGAWWVAVHGVTQSWKRLKWLSSSSSSSNGK